jgi:magnesium-transporting ATPase (P-type)
MMSVLIKHNGIYKLYCKGADVSILSRLSKQEQPFLQVINSQLDTCSRIGLRTLCMATRIFSENEVLNIKNKYLEISKSVNKNDLLKGFLDEIEREMFLIGCSAVEDRLQDEVPETIAKLLEASN